MPYPARIVSVLGNSGTTPTRITPFHFNDGIDDFFSRSFWTRPTPVIGRKQETVLSFDQHVMEAQESRGLKTIADRRTRAGRISKVHKPAMMRSEARRF